MPKSSTLTLHTFNICYKQLVMAFCYFRFSMSTTLTPKAFQLEGAFAFDHNLMIQSSAAMNSQIFLLLIVNKINIISRTLIAIDQVLSQMH